MRFYLQVLLVLLTVNFLLFTCCIQQGTEFNNSTQTNPTPIQTLPTIIRTNTIAQDDNYADYVKMDRDIYKTGDTIEFYLVNQETSLMECVNAVPTFRIYRLLENGTSVVIVNHGIVQPGVSYMQPGESSTVFNIPLTKKWMPGLYRIQFDCGSVSRKFMIE